MPEAFDAGNLHQESLETIWTDQARFHFSTGFDSRKLTGHCRMCTFGGLCRAGKLDGRGVYVSGQSPAAAPARRTAKVGRNDKCPCGSEKKYKRCCGAVG